MAKGSAAVASAPAPIAPAPTPAPVVAAVPAAATAPPREVTSAPNPAPIPPERPPLEEGDGNEERLAMIMAKRRGDTPAEAPAAEPEAGEEAPAVEEAAAEAPPEPETELTPAEKRRAWLEASKAHRKASEREKRAHEAEARLRETASRAEYVERARQGWEQNPLEVARALGIDPTAFGRRIVEYGMRNPAQEPDPVQQQVQQQLAPVAAELAQLREQAVQHQQRVEVSSIIARDVLPAVTTEACPVLMHTHGGNRNAAAVYVFNECLAAYQQTGRTIPFAEAAKIIERQLYADAEARYLAAKPKAAAAPAAPPPKPAPPRRGGRTITSELSTMPSLSRPNADREVSKNERIDEIIARRRAKG